jgi:hypothetical protein
MAVRAKHRSRSGGDRTLPNGGTGVRLRRWTG